MAWTWIVLLATVRFTYTRAAWHCREQVFVAMNGWHYTSLLYEMVCNTCTGCPNKWETRFAIEIHTTMCWLMIAVHHKGRSFFFRLRPKTLRYLYIWLSNNKWKTIHVKITAQNTDKKSCADFTTSETKRCARKPSFTFLLKLLLTQWSVVLTWPNGRHAHWWQNSVQIDVYINC